MKNDSTWEPVIGLEIHVQLNTKTKLFSHAPNHFGDEPNTNISPVDLGLPGSLPVLNEEAVKKAVQFGLAVGADIPKVSRFDRKSYFYPDSPRNFQITQFDHPIVAGGTINADVEGESYTFEIDHAHLEDDAGMLKHFSSFAGVDYNRAGVPLIEIVSKPCMHSPRQATTYVRAVKAIMEYIDASDCNMEEGSLRVDANISIRRKGETELRPKTEIKNMNSFHYLELAIEAEIKRQIKEYEANPRKDPEEVIKSGTYRWDAEKKEIFLMRSKESADDYRYFPEPDLVPLILDNDYIDPIREMLPELPHARFERYVNELELTEYNASILVNEKRLSDYFEDALKAGPTAKNLCTWITVEFAGKLKDTGKPIMIMPPEHVGKLVKLIENQTINGRIAKQVADDMIKNPDKDPEEIVKENPDYQPLTDVSEIEPLVVKVLDENPSSIAAYKAGKKKAFAFLVGQVMKLTRGKASPEIVNDLINKKLSSY